MHDAAAWTDTVPHGSVVAQPSALALHRVRKTFRGRAGEVDALAETDLVVARVEFVCLVGPSGCGKSTLLSLIAGLDLPTHGTIRAEGRRVTGPGRSARSSWASRRCRACAGCRWRCCGSA